MTATVPFLFLGVMFIRGVTLNGAADGMVAFIRPEFGKLLTFQVGSVYSYSYFSREMQYIFTLYTMAQIKQKQTFLVLTLINI